MSKYLLPHKKIGLAVIEWEKLHSKNQQTESLIAFIARKQAVYILGILLDKGWNEQKIAQELWKITGNAPSVKI